KSRWLPISVAILASVVGFAAFGAYEFRRQDPPKETVSQTAQQPAAQPQTAQQPQQAAPNNKAAGNLAASGYVVARRKATARFGDRHRADREPREGHGEGAHSLRKERPAH